MISLDEIAGNADSGVEISDVVDIEEASIAKVSAEEFLNALDETNKKIVDMLVKKFTQAEIADDVGLKLSILLDTIYKKIKRMR